jgi:hypothetical protein
MNTTWKMVNSLLGLWLVFKSQLKLQLKFPLSSWTSCRQHHTNNMAWQCYVTLFVSTITSWTTTTNSSIIGTWSGNLQLVVRLVGRLLLQLILTCTLTHIILRNFKISTHLALSRLSKPTLLNMWILGCKSEKLNLHLLVRRSGP